MMGERLGLPVVHLDALFWNAGWVPTDKSGFREKIAKAAAADMWVMDGNYSSHFDLRLPRAEAVIWLDLPRYIYFSRTLWRLIRNYGRERADIGPGCPERFELSFFRDWVWTYPAHSRGRHADLMANLPVGVHGITLRSPAEVRRFENSLPGSFHSS
jgi:adenylate kinase family enzyme